MKLLFDASNPENGKIYYAVKDADYFYFQHSTNIPLTEFEIDEVAPDNRDVCLDLIKYGNQHSVNADGNPKYYLAYNAGTEAWELNERDGWVEGTGGMI